MTPAAPQSRKQAWRSESGRLLHRDRRWGERHPPGNTPRELGGRGPVGDAWEQALQLAGCGNLAAALECRADHRGLVFGDSEHAKSMSACGPAGQAAGIRGRRHRGRREGRPTMARSSIPKRRREGSSLAQWRPFADSRRHRADHAGMGNAGERNVHKPAKSAFRP